jgi:hypothetical protein
VAGRGLFSEFYCSFDRFSPLKFKLVHLPLDGFLFLLEGLASGFSIQAPIDFDLAAMDSTIPSPALFSECLQVFNSSLASALS